MICVQKARYIIRLWWCYLSYDVLLKGTFEWSQKKNKKKHFILPLCCVQPGALNPFAAPNIDIGRSHHKSLHMSWCRASPKWTLLLESRKEKICGDFPKISDTEGVPEVFQQQKNWASNSWLSWPWSSTSFFKHLSLSQKSQESPGIHSDHKSGSQICTKVPAIFAWPCDWKVTKSYKTYQNIV